MSSKTRERSKTKTDDRKIAENEITKRRNELRDEHGEDFVSMPEGKQEAMARKAYLEDDDYARQRLRALIQRENSNLQKELDNLRQAYQRLKDGTVESADARVLADVDVQSIVLSNRTAEEKMEKLFEAFEELGDERQAAVQTVRGRQDVVAGNIASNQIQSDINTVSAMIKGWLSNDPESFFEDTLDEIGEDLSTRHAEVLAEELLQKKYESVDNPEKHFENKAHAMEELAEEAEALLGGGLDGVEDMGDVIERHEALKATAENQWTGVDQ